MIVTELYEGQGFGNQLWCYVVARVLALDKELVFGIQNPEKFKGKEFLNLDMGAIVSGGSGPAGGPPIDLPLGIEHYYSERVIRHPKNDFDIREVDEELRQIVANTKIDGIFQAEEYIMHRKEEIHTWLSYDVKELDIDFSNENICVINFRGGEYKRNPSVFLRRKYWRDAILRMKNINPSMIFVVITDDPSCAKYFFPDFIIRHYGIHGDYQAINNANYLILSNSSFGFFPAWLNLSLKVCIAPKYWAAHNISDGYWSCSYNLTRKWNYLDRKGNASNYEQCVEELRNYQAINNDVYEQKKIVNAFVLVSSFNNDLSWLTRYTDNYLVFERGVGSGIPSKLDRDKVRFVANNGSNYKDYFTYIIENYDSLPDLVYLLKGNVFPRHVRQHVFDNYLGQNTQLSIIDRKVHSTNFPLDYFGKDGMYYELNTDWFVHTGVPWKYFQTLDSLLQHFDKSFRPKLFTRFSIGAEYIVDSGVIRRIPKAMYQDLLEIVSHGGQPIGYTAECFLVERALDRLWQNKFHSSYFLNQTRQPLPSCSNLIIDRQFYKKILFASFDITARAINRPRVIASLIFKGLNNRLKLMRNYLT